MAFKIAFVCLYNPQHQDSEFVEGELLPKLESPDDPREHQYRLTFVFRMLLQEILVFNKGSFYHKIKANPFSQSQVSYPWS